VLLEYYMSVDVASSDSYFSITNDGVGDLLDVEQCYKTNGNDV